MDAESLLSLDLSTIRLPQGDEESERTVQHFLEILEEHRRLCVAQGKYAEAEISRVRIDELRRYEEHRRREAMVTYQLAERIAVEESNARELQRFNSAWDRAMTEYDAKTQELVEQMKLRHAQEFQEYQEELRLRYPLRPKFSRDLLNTRRIQQVLAKQNQYAEAHRVKTKADLVEEWEMGQQNKLWLDKLEKLERQFVSKQDTELAALVKRIQSGRVGQMRARQSEYERLLQHYQNIKKELLNQQNVERLKAEKHSAHANNKSTSLQYVPPIEVVPQSPVATRSQRVNALLEASQFHTVGQSPIAKAANAAAEAAYNSLTRTAPPQSARGSAAPVPSATTSGSTSASVSARRPQSAASSRPDLSQAQSLSAQTSPKGMLNTSTTSTTSNNNARAFNFAGAYASPFTASGAAVQNPQLPFPMVPSLPNSPHSVSSMMSGRSNGGVGLAAAVGVSKSVSVKQFVPVSRVSAHGSPSATDRISRTPKSNAR